jgi:hypothetical protein
MSDREYMDADYEVIGMVNRGHGPGGELPCVALSFVPADRAERVAALDRRLQLMQKVFPWASAAALILSGIALGRVM